MGSRLDQTQSMHGWTGSVCHRHVSPEESSCAPIFRPWCTGCPSGSRSSKELVGGTVRLSWNMSKISFVPMNRWKRIDFYCCAAAFIKAANRGCGLWGRPLNSGWNWLPTMNGWSFTSTISINSRSGDVPEITKPFSSNFLRKSLLNS